MKKAEKEENRQTDSGARQIEMEERYRQRDGERDGRAE